MDSLISLKKLRQQRKKDNFVGRKEEIELFTQMIRNSIADSYPILSISGIGGIGKSTLLRKYIEICKEENIPYAIADGRDERVKAGIVNGKVVCNLPEVLRIWRSQLDAEKKSKLFQEFDKIIDRFTGIMQKYWARENSNMQGADVIEDFTANTTGGLIGATIAGIPGVILGAAIGSATGKIVNAIGRTSPHLLKAGLTKDEVDFCLSIEDNLAQSFVMGLNKLIENHGRVVILIDTFEMISSFQEWILKCLFDTDISANICFAIAGREGLDQNRWRDWKHLIKEIELHALPFGAVSEFLAKHEIYDRNLLTKVQRVSNGIPWAMALLTENLAIMDGDWELIIEKGLPYEIARQMVERFLDQIEDERERIVVEACAVPLSFDADVIKTMIGDQFPEVAVWKKIMQYSFFGTLPSGRIFMLDPIREFIFNRLKVERPLTLHGWNQHAHEYYRQIIRSSEKKLKDYIWEFLYHYFFDDLEAYSLFLPQREFMDHIEISIPSLKDIKQIVDIDCLIFGGDDPEILYTYEDIEKYMVIDPSMFRIAIDRKLGRVTGYALVVAPRKDWCRKFETNSDYSVHVFDVTNLDKIDDFGDYFIDTIAAINPRDRVTSAMLLRSILPILAKKPRKFYAIATSIQGNSLVNKLQMNYLSTRQTDKVTLECYYLCLYSGQYNSPLYEALEKYKPDVPREVACKGCMIKGCEHYPKNTNDRLIIVE